MTLTRLAPYLFVLLAIVVACVLVVLAVDHQLAARVFALGPDIISGHH